MEHKERKWYPKLIRVLIQILTWKCVEGRILNEKYKLLNFHIFAKQLSCLLKCSFPLMFQHL